MTTRRSPRLRWRIAYLLDRLPGQCWTRLVCWALGGPADTGSPWSPQDDLCRTDAARNGACYCGKVRAAGTNTPSPTAEES